jgi:hypothetical protein
LEENDTDYGNIPLHSHIRLGVRENVCNVFELRKEILLFLQTESLGQEFQRGLHVMGFIRSLSFVAPFKCPEFEVVRQRAEYISPSRSQ